MNCIIVLNIGNRPYINHSRNSMVEYSKKCNSDIFFITELSLTDKITENLKLINGGRNNISVYVQKIYSIYEYLGKYEKVLLLDDTCIVTSKTPNLFKLLKKNSNIYAVSEKHKSAIYKREFIFIKKTKNIEINEYVNTGVMLVHRDNRIYFSEKYILDNIKLFESKYPNQAYINYLFQNKFSLLEKKYNFSGLLDKNTELRSRDLVDIYELDNLIKNNYIFHITGYYKNREHIIKIICMKKID